MKRIKYYWDACLFVSWLQNEKRVDPTEMAGLKDVLELNERGEVVLVTSTLTQLEVLGSPPDEEVRRKFLDACQRPEVQVVNPSRNIVETALSLRAKRNLPVMDAVHLATAIQSQVAELHTFDEDDLLKLDGDPEIPLRIVKPRVAQMDIEFPESEDDDTE
ncbi:MAG: hypothetical protein B1H03_03725 [Planctomycetales bacterium 4484_113]|nr:MAG: hypothetical protein B1H03_03725 [Planctomycetales bacterium 4484_113]